jgi:putative peptidoglycan lipid II flippase
MPAYLGRDVLVRVFYALGDGTTPFRLSMAGIGLNVLFDWVLVGGPSPWGPQLPFSFGAPGLVLATVAINLITCTALLLVLQRRLGGLPLFAWGRDALALCFAAVLAGVAAWAVSLGWVWAADAPGRILQVGVSASVGLLVGLRSGVPELAYLVRGIRRRISSR